MLLGVLSAIYKDSFFDRITAIISTLGMSVPSFFSAILFAWFFGFVLHEFTGLEMTGSLYEVDDFGEGSTLQLKNLLLPAIVLGIRPLAVIIQLMRNSLLEVLNEDYVSPGSEHGSTHWHSTSCSSRRLSRLNQISEYFVWSFDKEVNVFGN